MRFAMGLPASPGLRMLTRRDEITNMVSRRKDFRRMRGAEPDRAKPNRGGQEQAELAGTAPETAREVVDWLAHLGAERRMSPETVEAYERDVRQFLGFLAAHFGRRVSLAMLRDLATRDVRAFMAHRRGDGIGGRSLMRALAGARSFARFLERQGHGTVAALAAVRA